MEVVVRVEVVVVVVVVVVVRVCRTCVGPSDSISSSPELLLEEDVIAAALPELVAAVKVPFPCK